MLNPLVAASKECKERAGARLHGAAGEQEDRTCSGAQASSRDWRANEGSAGRGGGMAGVRQKRAGREQQQRAVRTSASREQRYCGEARRKQLGRALRACWSLAAGVWQEWQR